MTSCQRFASLRGANSLCAGMHRAHQPDCIVLHERHHPHLPSLDLDLVHLLHIRNITYAHHWWLSSACSSQRVSCLSMFVKPFSQSFIVVFFIVQIYCETEFS